MLRKIFNFDLCCKNIAYKVKEALFNHMHPKTMFWGAMNRVLESNSILNIPITFENILKCDFG